MRRRSYSGLILREALSVRFLFLFLSSHTKQMKVEVEANYIKEIR